MIGKAAPGLKVYELKVVDGYRSDLVRVIRVPQDARLDVMAELIVRAMGISGGAKWWLKAGRWSYTKYDLFTDEKERREYTNAAEASMRDLLRKPGDAVEISTWVGCQEFRLGVKLVAIRRAKDRRYPLCTKASCRILDVDLSEKDLYELYDAYDDGDHPRHAEAVECMGRDFYFDDFLNVEVTRWILRVPSRVWIGDWSRLKSGSWLVMWIDEWSSQPVLFDVVHADERLGAASSLVERGRIEARLVPPVSIVVQDPGLAALVREAVGVRTEVVLDAGGKREGWKKTIRRRVTPWIEYWHQDLLIGGGSYLCEGRNDPGDAKRFLDAAGRFLSAEPWAGIAPHMALEMTVMGHEYLVCVLGGGRGTPGLMILDSPADYLGLGGTGTTGLPRMDFEASGKMVFLHFVQEGALDPRLVAECNDLGWNRGTFPRPFIRSGGKSYMPDSSDLFVMSCACHAIEGLSRSRQGRIRDDVKQKRRCSVSIGSGRRISVGLCYPHPAIAFERPTYDHEDPETDAAVQDAIRFIRDAQRKHGLSEDPDPIES